MRICATGKKAYGQNDLCLGVLAADGCIRKDGVVVMRVVRDQIFSMHDQYLGHCIDGVGKSSNGSLLFVLREDL